MYSLILLLHSWGRWLVLILLAMLGLKAYQCWMKKRGWGRHDHLFRIITLGVFDFQFLLGLLLYFFYSPIVKVALQPDVDMMADPHLRFFALEHFFAMSIALIVLHIGGWMSKRTSDPQIIGRRLTLSIIFTLLIVLVSIPWPFFPYGRTLFRFG